MAVSEQTKLFGLQGLEDGVELFIKALHRKEEARSGARYAQGTTIRTKTRSTFQGGGEEASTEEFILPLMI